MAIKKYDKATVLMVRAEIEKAIKETCDRLGVKAPSLGNMTYTDHTLTSAKLVFGILTPKIDKDSIGLMGQVFKQGAGRFTVTVIHDTYVVAKSARGKNYRISYEQLNTMMTDNLAGARIGERYNL
jgi:hypothetical protein